jgi:hypothetical protein
LHGRTLPEAQRSVSGGRHGLTYLGRRHGLSSDEGNPSSEEEDTPMRKHNAVTALLVAVVALLTLTVVGLFACDRPQAAGPDPGPGSAAPSPDPTRDGGRGAGSTQTGGKPAKSKASAAPGKSKNNKNKASKPPVEVTQHRDLAPPRLGNASVPDYDLSDDGQAFTVRFADLQADADAATSRSFTMTVPFTGNTADAVVEYGVSGYAITDESSGATLTVTACGRSQRRPFRSEFDDDFVMTLAVPLRGVRECAVNLKIEVRGAAALATIVALDAQLI